MIDKYLKMKKELNHRLDSYNNSYQKNKYYNEIFKNSKVWFYSYLFFLMQTIGFIITLEFIASDFSIYLENLGFINENNTLTFNLSSVSFLYNDVSNPDFSFTNNVFLITLFAYLSAFYFAFRTNLLKLSILFVSYCVLIFNGLNIPLFVFNIFYISGVSFSFFSFLPVCYFGLWIFGHFFEEKQEFKVGYLYLFRNIEKVKNEIQDCQSEFEKNKNLYCELEDEIDKYENTMIKDLDTMKYIINIENKENFENILNKFEKESKNKNNYYQTLLNEKFNNIVIDNE